jgi:hypothetical protein
MGKVKKKRNKKYAGRDAKTTGPQNIQVRKIEAVNRGRIKQWVFEHKKLLKRTAIVVVVGGIFLFLMIQGFMSLGQTR